MHFQTYIRVKGQWRYLYRAVKRRINASQHFRSFWGAWRTIAGYEAIHMIRPKPSWNSGLKV